MSDSDEEPPVITFPAYVVTLKDASGLMLAGGDGKFFLPVFTDRDSAQTFGERTGMSPHPVLELPNAECLAILLSNPPSRSGKFSAQGIILDPLPRLESGRSNVTVYSLGYILELLKKL